MASKTTSCHELRSFHSCMFAEKELTLLNVSAVIELRSTLHVKIKAHPIEF